MDIGSAVGRESGITEEKLAALPDYDTHPAFSEAERLALRYADQMTATPVDVDENAAAALRTHFSEKQLVELTAAIAWENHRARFDHAMGVESEGFSEKSFCVIPQRPRPAEKSMAQPAAGDGSAFRV